MKELRYRIVGLLLKLLNETSTLRGAVSGFVLLCGWTLAPEKLEAALAIAAGVSYVLKMILPDKWKDDV